MKQIALTYFPGIVLFIFALVISIATYKDYGISWDEPTQRDIGYDNYNYIFKGAPTLFQKNSKIYGSGFEMPLVWAEQKFKISGIRKVYLMRHFVTHLFFLIGVFFGYILTYRLFKNHFIACLGFFMIAFMPRIYAHSFFNTKDIPFLSMLLIIFALSEMAFAKKKLILFFLLGIACGYTTSIRILGILPTAILTLFLIIDLIIDVLHKKNVYKSIAGLLFFLVCFCLTLYSTWPMLWHKPLYNFIEAYNTLSHFVAWNGIVLINGKTEHAIALPWTYIPTWFLITTPVIWLAAGFAGIIWTIAVMVRKPLTYLQNTPQRNFLLYLLCFGIPVIMVIVLRSVVYDDWRHLYFIYPSFVMLALFVIDRLSQGQYGNVTRFICLIQVVSISFFMVKNHPFQQIYFNHLVSHKQEYLRKNYELDYWGVSYKQGLEFLLSNDHSESIKVYANFTVLGENNLWILPATDRQRIKFVEDMDTADYFITNFRFHPEDYNYPKTVYTAKVLNSTILGIYKMH